MTVRYRSPRYARCDACGRSAHKVAVGYPGELQALGYCPRCFEHKAEAAQLGQPWALGSDAVLVYDHRVRKPEAERAAVAVGAFLVAAGRPEPGATCESETGRRLWAACGHPAERDVFDCCYTCGGAV